MSSRAILVVLVAAGCTRWRTPPLAPHEVVTATPHAKRIRVTLTDSSALVLKDPIISGDSIAGRSSGTRISVPYDRIARTELPVRQNEPPGLVSSWHTQRRSPQRVISEKERERVRLTLTDSSVLVLEYPVSLGDSVIGLAYGRRTAVASAHIVRAAIRAENHWKMFGVVSLYAALCFALGGDSPDSPGHR